ncbi:MAG: thiamine-phosphate kinase [Victivallales bacterium]|nr:thiamine-phosphate kinase [Victivallales bacterium]
MDENGFLNSIFPLLKNGGDIIVGPGDDCAVIDIGNSDQYFLLAADQIISDIHFDYTTTTPEQAGAKLIKRNISDIAAMGGIPAHALVTLAADKFDREWLFKFYKGLTGEAEKWDISICGGDIASLPDKLQPDKKKNDNCSKPAHQCMNDAGHLFAATLTITGFVKKNKLSLRKNAKPGDILFATGKFGNSFSSGHHINFIPQIAEASFISGRYSTAMMDVSDGLLIDLQRMAKASNITILLDPPSLPFRNGTKNIGNALTDGEDYNLVFSVSGRDKADEIINNWPFDTELSRIGQILQKRDRKEVVEKSIDFELTDLIRKYINSAWDHLIR